MARLTRTRLISWIAGAAALLGLVALAALVLGPGHVDLGTALWSTAVPNPDRDILLSARLPRMVLGIIAGGALAAAGAGFQGMLRNPLADPFILGVSGGAALGGTVAIAVASLLTAAGMVGIGTFLGGAYATPLAAFAGATASVLLVYRIARRAGGGGPLAILLVGVIFNAFAAAVIMFVKTIVSAEKAQELLYWLMGTLSGGLPTPALVAAAVLSTTGIVALVALSGRLNLLALGEESAAHLGVDVKRTQTLIFLAASLTVGASVSVTGMIGFVGLIVPHAVRMAAGPDHRLLVPVSALLGGAFLVACDTVARLSFVLLHSEPPVGVLTAFAGGPFFLILLRRRGAAYRLDAS